MLRICSWNIRQGGGSRISKIAELLTSKGYELLIISEFKTNANGKYLQGQLLKAGYQYQFTEANNHENAVLIASKIEGEPLRFLDADPVYGANVIGIKFELFSVLGVYLPHKKKHILFDSLIQRAKLGNCIVAGDFNTGHNHIDQEGDSFWYQTDLKAFENEGMVDAFRYMHHSLKTYSWFSHQGNGYRYDHTYVHHELKGIIKSCDYLHDWRTEGLSDHSAMLLSLA